MKKSTIFAICLGLSVSLSVRAASSDDKILISAVGDVIIHDAPYNSILNDPQQFFALWSNFKPLFEVADISYANFEGAAARNVNQNGSRVSDVGFSYNCQGPKVYCGTNFSFNYHPHVIRDLQKVGIDVVSTANNHALDRRSLGVDETIKALVQYQMPFTGTRTRGATSDRWEALVSRKNKTIAFLSCTQETNGIPDPHKQVLKCASEDMDQTLARLQADAKISAVIVTPHWGDEYTHRPNQSQVRLAKKWADMGVTAILGSHPHVLQPVEWVRGADGNRTLVAYSLGNFIARQGGVAKNLGAVLYLSLERTNQGKMQVSDVSSLPFFLGDLDPNEYPYRFRLTPIDQMPSVGGEMRSIINQTLKQTRQIQSRRVRDLL
jgi:poly-gamma-glutamate synthesis protein (capsule biosynthesis protein)